MLFLQHIATKLAMASPSCDSSPQARRQPCLLGKDHVCKCAARSLHKATGDYKPEQASSRSQLSSTEFAMPTQTCVRCTIGFVVLYVPVSCLSMCASVCVCVLHKGFCLCLQVVSRGASERAAVKLACNHDRIVVA